MRKLGGDLQEKGELQDITVKFLEVLTENKRLTLLRQVTEKYMKLYSVMNREEKITIISAHDLDSSERDEVAEALRQGQSGTTFSVEYQVNPAIQGGLQMYTESRFMDMSLKTRLDRIQGEISRLTS